MKLFRMLGALVAAFGLSICAAQAANPTVLKMGYTLSTTSHYAAGANAFADELGKRTGGRFKIEQFPSGALGGERELVEGTQLGTVDMAISSTGPVANFVPEVGIVDIPFLFRDYAHARAVLDGPIGQDLLAKIQKKGLMPLAWGENGFRHLTNNKRPVKAPEDAKGLKVRTMENPIHISAFKTLGILPTPMAFPELFTALQQGTVDGQENPIPVITSSKFGQVQKHLSLTGHVYSPALFLIAPNVYNALPEADKKAFLEAAKVGVQAMRKKVEEFDTKGVEELKAQGMQVVTQVDSAKFQQALGPAYAEYGKRFGAANIDKIRNYK